MEKYTIIEAIKIIKDHCELLEDKEIKKIIQILKEETERRKNEM